MEDKIRKLCTQILATNGREDLGPVLVELRDALHRHIEGLRARLGAYPFVVDRRVRRDGDPTDHTVTPQEALSQTDARDNTARTKPAPKRVIAS